MVKGIVNAFDHMGFCLVLNLIQSDNYLYRCQVGCYMATKFATKYVSFATHFYTG